MPGRDRDRLDPWDCFRHRTLTLVSAQEGLDLARFCTAPIARLGQIPFENDGTFPGQYRAPSTRIIEQPVDVFEDGHLGLPVRFP